MCVVERRRADSGTSTQRLVGNCEIPAVEICFWCQSPPKRVKFNRPASDGLGFAETEERRFILRRDQWPSKIGGHRYVQLYCSFFSTSLCGQIQHRNRRQSGGDIWQFRESQGGNSSQAARFVGGFRRDCSDR